MSDETQEEKEQREWDEAHPRSGPLLPEVFRPIRIGARFRRALGTRQRADKTWIETPVGKKDRRVARRLAMRGRVDRTLASSRMERLEVEKLATNSHERKRYRELLAKTKRAEREAKRIALQAAAEASAKSSAPTSTPSSSSNPSDSTT